MKQHPHSMRNTPSVYRYLIIGATLGVFLFFSGCTPGGVRQALQEAERLSGLKQSVDALAIIDTALISYPNNQKLTKKRVELLVETEKFNEFLAGRPQLTSRQQQALYREYIIAQMRVGNAAQALLDIEEKITQQPSSDLRQLKGQALYLGGNIAAALDAYDTAIQLDPTNQDAYVNKALALADAGMYYEAIELLDEILTQHPENHLLWYNKGTILSDLGFQQRNVAGMGAFSYYSDALRHFEQAYRLRPTHTNTHIWIGITHLDLGQYDKAENILQTVISSHPMAYDAWYYLAKNAAAQQKFDEAIQFYEHLLSINPEYSIAEQELIIIRQQQQESEQDEQI